MVGKRLVRSHVPRLHEPTVLNADAAQFLRGRARQPRMPRRTCAIALDASLTGVDGAGRAVVQPVDVGDEDAGVLISRWWS